jgi:hypothetical protein
MIQTASLPLGDATVDVQYEFTPAEAAVFYPNDRAHPGTPADAAIVAVLIGGQRIDDPESVFSEWQLETWSTAILESGAADPRDKATSYDDEDREREDLVDVELDYA